jgi:hypothetical protein
MAMQKVEGSVCDAWRVASDADPVSADVRPSDVGVRASPIGESRWPPVAAILIFMVLNVALRLWLPSDTPVHLPWLVPSIEAVLVVALITSNPTSPAEHRRLRRFAVVIVGVLVAAALWSTAVLIDDLIGGSGVAKHADQLLATGAVVWLGNILAFSLLYWLLDGGGPIARSRGAGAVDLAFTQHMSPELAPPGWRPVFLDYLHLGFTNATAFSPTDVMPLTHRAKYAMIVQSTVALALFGLVVASAVGALK